MRYRNWVWVESIGAFHVRAPAGTLVEVVVCIPLTNRQRIMSPTWALIVAGWNVKFWTVTRILAADAADALHMANATARRSIFFIMVLALRAYSENFRESQNSISKISYNFVTRPEDVNAEFLIVFGRPNSQIDET
jgi:hypothetical protein